MPQVEGLVGAGDEVTGQDNLVYLALPDHVDSAADDVGPHVVAHGAADGGHPPWGAHRFAGGGQGAVAAGGAQLRHPRELAAPADDDLRHGEHGTLPGAVGVESEGPYGQRPGSVLTEKLAVMVDLRGDLVPPHVGGFQPVGLEAGHLAQPDEALVAADERGARPALG